MSRESRRIRIASLALPVLWGTLAVNARADEVLFDFDGGFDFGAVEARDVKVSGVKRRGGQALRMVTGRAQDWPGVTLKAPEGHWDLSAFTFLALDVRNVGNNRVTVSCRVDNPGADGVRNCNAASVELGPGRRGTLVVQFKRMPPGRSSIRLFGMRGYPIPQSEDRTIDPANVAQLIVFVPKPKLDHAFEIDNIRAGGRYAFKETGGLKPEEFFPFIDTFGQYKHEDWPGKTHSLDEMRGSIETENAELAGKPGPADWDRYGGWEKGPELRATGFFRTEKLQGKWWLVDPEGRLFFSHGIDCVNAWGATPIEERENWFEDIPPREGEYAGFYGRQRSIHYHYKGRSPLCFDFIRANLLRKLGPGWRESSTDLTHRRLRSWGLNTIANWSDESVYLKRKTPYCVAVHFGGKLLEGSQGYWGQFRDVFDPDFREQVTRRMAREKGKTAGDPWCIGYFLDNEISWGDDVSLAVAALVSPASQRAKQVLVDDLKAKYGAIAGLNRAWGTGHVSWDALLEHRGAPDKRRAREDLVAFYTKTAEQYFRTCRDAVKEVAPDNLYLGCRFAWVNDKVASVAAKYCDVVSYNIYRRSAANFRFPGKADVPLVIGEFHFGALDRGMFHTGLVPVKDQAERAKTYREYVRGVLRHPQFVGCHWFKYRDEPTTGRPLDAENYQIGFVDIADTPYPETIEACREVGYTLYEYRLRGR